MAFLLRGLPLLLSVATVLTADVVFEQTVRQTNFDDRVPVKSEVPGISPPVVDIPLELYSPPFPHAPVATAKIVISGNRLAVLRKDLTEIFDIDAETVTLIRPKERSYVVETFAAAERRNREQLAQWSSYNHSPETYSAAIQKTGRTEQVQGKTAEQYRIVVIGVQGKRHVAASAVYWVLPEAPLGELAAFQARWAKATTLPFPGMPSAEQDPRDPLGVLAKAARSLPGYTICYVDELRPLPEALRLRPTYEAQYDASKEKINDEIAPKSPVYAQPDTAIWATETSFSNFQSDSADSSVFMIPAGYKNKKGRLPAILP